MMRYVCILVHILVCLEVSTLYPLKAQSKDERDSLHHIQEVLITAERKHNTLMPAQSLSGKDLARLSVYSVADALRYFAGLQIKDYGGIAGLKTVNVRSLGSHHLGVFYDGVQIGNAQNGVVDLGRFALDNMDLLSLYNGQSSQLLQSARAYASSGALYLHTRRPTFAEGKSHKLSYGLDVGSFATIKPKLTWAYSIAPSLSLSTSAEMLYSSGRYPFRYKKSEGYEVLALRENGDIFAWRSEANLWGQSPWASYSTKLYWYRSERGYPGASVREEPGVFRHQDRQWDNNLFIQHSFRGETGRHQWQALLKYAYDYLHYRSDPRLDVRTMYVDNRYQQHELYASVATVQQWARAWSTALSQDIQYNILNANLLDFAYPRRVQLLTALSTAYKGKYLRLQSSLLHTYSYDHTRSPRLGQSSSVLSPSVSLAYYPTGQEGFNIRAFYKDSYRLPSFNDLYYGIIGGTQLKPERTQQYNIGWHYRHHPSGHKLRKYEVQADLYYNRVRDKIVAMPTANQFRWTMLNYGLVDIIGLDCSAQMTYAWGQLRLSPRLSYTYQSAREHTERSSPFYGGQIPYIPWHSGSLVIGAEYGAWFLHYSLLYTGERYHSVTNIAEYHIQPWYTQDISLGRSWRLWGQKLRTVLEINNLFNQSYEVVLNYPMPGIHFNFKLQADV